MYAARIYLCERGYYRSPLRERVCGTYVYLDGKHSHDYVACNAIPSASALPNSQQPSRERSLMSGRACCWYAAVAFLRARMPPVFNDLIKNVSSTRDSRHRPPERLREERERERERDLATTSGYLRVDFLPRVFDTECIIHTSHRC